MFCTALHAFCSHRVLLTFVLMIKMIMTPILLYSSIIINYVNNINLRLFTSYCVTVLFGQLCYLSVLCKSVAYHRSPTLTRYCTLRLYGRMIFYWNLVRELLNFHYFQTDSKIYIQIVFINFLKTIKFYLHVRPFWKEAFFYCSFKQRNSFLRKIFFCAIGLDLSTIIEQTLAKLRIYAGICISRISSARMRRSSFVNFITYSPKHSILRCIIYTRIYLIVLELGTYES